MKNPFKLRQLSPTLLFLQFVIIVIFGVIAIVDELLAFSVARYLLCLILLITGVSYSMNLFYSQHKKRKAIFMLCTYVILGAVPLFFPIFTAKSVSQLFGIWFIINGVAQIVISIQCFLLNLRGKVRYGITGAVNFIFGISLLFWWDNHAKRMIQVIGIYLLIYSLSSLINAIAEVLLYGTIGAKIKNKIKISLPVFFTALLPGKIIDDFNKYFELNPKEAEKLLKHPKDYDKGKCVFEVYIHMSNQGQARVGHADFRYKNKLYSYGCFDQSSNSFFGLMSDGTMFISDPKPYIEHCIGWEKQVVVGFGIALNDEQKLLLEKNIAEMEAKLVNWQTDYEKGIADRENPDLASRYIRDIGGKIYKVKKGSFRKYFTINTNCVKLVDKFIGVSGIGIVSMNGIIVPGAYYSMLNDLYESKDSTVVERNIYKEIE